MKSLLITEDAEGNLTVNNRGFKYHELIGITHYLRTHFTIKQLGVMETVKEPEPKPKEDETPHN